MSEAIKSFRELPAKEKLKTVAAILFCIALLYALCCFEIIGEFAPV